MARSGVVGETSEDLTSEAVGVIRSAPTSRQGRFARKLERQLLPSETCSDHSRRVGATSAPWSEHVKGLGRGVRGRLWVPEMPVKLAGGGQVLGHRVAGHSASCPERRSQGPTRCC